MVGCLQREMRNGQEINLQTQKIPSGTIKEYRKCILKSLQYYNWVADVLILSLYLTTKLIHEDLKMNATPFSVDITVGFMTELGDGRLYGRGPTLQNGFI
jgi:hypothetical protein